MSAIQPAGNLIPENIESQIFPRPVGKSKVRARRVCLICYAMLSIESVTPQYAIHHSSCELIMEVVLAT